MPHDGPLHKMANEGDKHEILSLLDSTPTEDINAAGAQGRTPLHRALGSGFTETAELLLQRKADVTIIDHMSRTSLHWAALCATDRESRECIELLFACGGAADMINAQSQSGSTPLHCALSRGHMDAAKLLVQKGADIKTIKDEDGMTCSKLASEAKMSAVLKAK